MSPPRVLLATDFFVRYASGLARGLADGGAEVVLLTRDHDQEFGNVAGAMRSFVAATLGGTAEHVELGGRVRDPAALGRLRAVRRRRRALRPDVVHFQDGVANDPRLVLAAGARPRGYALTVHDPVRHPGDRVPRPVVDRTRRALVRGAGLLFVHGERLREELIEVTAVKAPVVVVPHGVDAPAFSALPPVPSLLFFGRLSYYKGLDVLLDALPAVWERRPEVTLTVAGSGALPEHALLADRRVIVRREHVPDAEVPTVFGAATCVVLPYRQASQSGVGSLAKRFGRALIATSIGGLPELITPETGRLVPPEDPAALAAAILEVVGDAALAERMGRAAAGSIDAETSWARVASLTMAAYERHLRRSSGL